MWFAVIVVYYLLASFGYEFYLLVSIMRHRCPVEMVNDNLDPEYLRNVRWEHARVLGPTAFRQQRQMGVALLETGVCIQSRIQNILMLIPFESIVTLKLIRNPLLPFQTGIFIEHRKPSIPCKLTFLMWKSQRFSEGVVKGLDSAKRIQQDE